MRVTLLDHLPGPYNEGRLLELEQNWMYKLGTYEKTNCNPRLELTARRRVNSKIDTAAHHTAAVAQ